MAPVALRVGPAGSSLALLSRGKAEARTETPDLVAVLYSDASDIWQAQTWRELQPDAVSLTALDDGGAALEVASFGGLPIELHATAEVRASAPDRREVSWHVTVINHALGTVVGVAGPALAGIEPRAGAYLYVPNRPGHRIPNPWRVLAAAPHHLVYPVPASMQYLVYADDLGGVAYDVFDSGMVYKELVFGGPSRELSTVQYPFIAPGGRWDSPEILWQVLPGDWHLAADRYRSWFRTWAKKPEVSPEVRAFPIMGGTVIKARPVDDAHLHDVMKKQEVGTYAAALEQARKLRAAGYQGTHLVGWFGQGHDTTYPDFDPSPAMGGVGELKALVDGMHNMGMLVTFYLNARLANVNNPTFLAHPDWAADLAGGGLRHETYGNQTFTVLCPDAAGFREHLLRAVLAVARDYRGDGVQLDQIGAAPSVLCFDRRHGHRTPATAWAEGYTKMLREYRAAARRINPDFWFWTEGAWEGAGQYVDASQGGFWPDVPGATYFPEMYRYTLPEHPLFGDPSMGGVPFWCPTDIHRAARINAAVGDVFLHGDFRDNIGLTTLPDTGAHWFRWGRKIVVTVSNGGKTSQTYAVRLHLVGCEAQDPPAEGRAIAAEAPVKLAHDGQAVLFRVEVPPHQVEAVLLTAPPR